MGISVDTRPALKVYAERLDLEFSLLSDFPNNDVNRLYGVLNEERGVDRRTTFVIDKNGVIRQIDSGQDALKIVTVKDTCSKLN